jgi:hypothetical protein
VSEERDELPDQWDPVRALSALKEEADLFGRSAEAQTRHVIAEAGPAAAAAVVFMALQSANEKVRLEAARYILDRNLGRVGEEKKSEAEVDPLEQFLGDDIVFQAERILQESGGEL